MDMARWYRRNSVYHYYYWIGFLLLFAGVEGSAQPSNNATVIMEEDVEDSAATGRLNQFNGFYTPRPFPPSAQFTYSSVWASWSAWSFCANNAQIRVRACNTVRGFSCLGPNRESRPCGRTLPPPPPLPPGAALIDAERRRQQLSGGERDYDAADPWAEDRREALRQLYANYDQNGSPPSLRPEDVGMMMTKKKKLEKSPTGGGPFLLQAKSAGRTLQGGSPTMALGAGFASPQRNRNSYGGGPVGPPLDKAQTQRKPDGPAKAPSMTPELLFGSRLEAAEKPINSTATFEPEAGVTTSGTSASSFTATTSEADRSRFSANASTIPQQHSSSIDLTDNEVSTASNRIEPFADGNGTENTELPQKPVSESHSSLLLPTTTSATRVSSNAFEEQKKQQGTNNNPREQQQRTTIAEMPMQSPPPLSLSKHFSVSSLSLPSSAVSGGSGLLDGEPPLHTVLHSGEVTFDQHHRRGGGRNGDDQIITPETARALEWMLANMTRAADAELRHLEAAAGGSSVASGKKILRKKTGLHSGEAIVPRLRIKGGDAPVQPSQNPDGGVGQNRLFSVKSHPSAAGALKMSAEALHDGDSGKVARGRHGGSVEMTPGVTAVEIAESLDGAAEKENTAVGGGDETPEQMEAELAKIQQVMRQIETELDALREAEAGRVNPEEPPSNEFGGGGLKVVKLPATPAAASAAIISEPQLNSAVRPPILRHHRPTVHGGEVVMTPRAKAAAANEGGVSSSMAVTPSSSAITDPPGLYLNLVPTLNDTTTTHRGGGGKLGANPPTTGGERNKILLVQELSESKVFAEWSEWRPWAECFCDRQVRTRVCKYDDAINSKGCTGRSYESRHCISAADKCPNRAAAQRKKSAGSGESAERPPTTPLFYTLAPPRPQARRDADVFRPNPLALASLTHVVIGAQ